MTKEFEQINITADRIPQHLDIKKESSETLPPSEEFIRLITEQLILPYPLDNSLLLQEISPQEFCDLQTLEVELPILYPFDIQYICSSTPPVVIHDRALTEFLAGKDRCSKFINQDLTFLQPSVIKSAFRNSV